jgi:hypothetical protein
MQIIPISSIETCKRQQGFRTPVAIYLLLDSLNSSPRPGNGAVWRIIGVPNNEGTDFSHAEVWTGRSIVFPETRMRSSILESHTNEGMALNLDDAETARWSRQEMPPGLECMDESARGAWPSCVTAG